MNRKLIHLIAVGLVLLSFTLLRIYADQGHLEPCPVICTSYDSAVFSGLLNSTEPRLWKIVFPGVGGQSAVILDEKTEYDDQDDREVKSRQLFLKYLAFKKKIKPQHPYRYDPNDHYSVDLSNDPERCEVPIDIDFATALENAWTGVLMSTKYSDRKNIRYRTGATYAFYCDRHYGYTDNDSPEGGCVAMLIRLGEKLGLLAKSQENDRDALKKQCLEPATAIKKTTNPNQTSEVVRQPKKTEH